MINIQFSVPQIEYPLGGSSKKGSHVYSCHGTTIVRSDCTIVTLGYHGSIRTTFISNNRTIWQDNSITQKICNRKYTWLPFSLLPHSGYSIWGTENWPSFGYQLTFGSTSIDLIKQCWARPEWSMSET